MSIDKCTGLQFALPGYEFSLGTMIRALDTIRAGELDRAYIFGIPGHHAHRDWGHGYCLLNPLAAAAVYATEIGFRTVLMLDWDFHHGDGTQEVLAGLPNVHCIGVHAADYGSEHANWTNDDFATLTNLVLDLAETNKAPVLSVHGGGYNRAVTVSAAEQHVRTLLAR
ncbi:MAG: hypothetical protein EA426_18110 [Spirochaetaceae bacterium]|nr:MAG: hypothetical protein EA426_18110 [Spirochaetaceae bacterium]